MTNPALDALRRNVTGRIESGDATPIVAQEAHNYILYVEQNFPGNVTFDLHEVNDVTTARELVEAAADELMIDCTGRIYPWTEENWALAREYANIGCPFDYPDFVVERDDNGDYYATRA